MKFEIEFDVKDDKGGEPPTVDQVAVWLATDLLCPDVNYEMPLIPNDPYHDKGGFDDYQTIYVRNVKVKVIP